MSVIVYTGGNPVTVRDVAVTPPTGSVFDNLARGFVRRLGTYCNPDPQWTVRCRNISDDSGCAADPKRHKLRLFGGSHGPSQESDMREFDTLIGTWGSNQVSTNLVDMNGPNCDTAKGRWINTNQPVARHTYSMLVVRGDKFHVLTAYCQPTNLLVPDLPYFTGKICYWDFTTKTWVYTNLNQPWQMYSGAVLDPVSNNIYVFGNAQDFFGTIWKYDPDAGTIQTGPRFGLNGQPTDAVYCPDDDRFYLFQNNGAAVRVAINRTNLSASISTVLTTTGPKPMQARPIGYPSLTWDNVNKRIGGMFINGVHSDFNPATLVWTATTVQLETGTTGVCSNDFSCSAFMDDIGCYVFVQIHPTLGPVTWVYRP